MDITDKQFLGWEVYALSQNSTMYRADIRLEKTGSQLIFTDQYKEIDGCTYLDWYLDRYIDQYKQYDYQAIGIETEPDENLQPLFYGSAERGVDDWTKVFKYFQAPAINIIVIICS